MVAYEDLIMNDRPDMVLVVGDVNSTLACSLVATKLHIPVGHVEAGLRSGDMQMPEEINRIVADRVSVLLFTTCEDGVVNLIQEGVNQQQIIEVGNTMIDSLMSLLPRASESSILDDCGVEPQNYVLATLHRPSNVDDPDNLEKLLETLVQISRERPVLFPVHPRTRQKIENLSHFDPNDAPQLHLLDPLPYLDFVKAQKEAELVITDSGGVQEETTALGVQCLTARDNTERPVTVTRGTNRLIGTDPVKILEAAREVLAGDIKEGGIVPMWDGKAGERIAQYLAKLAKAKLS
jgi:UDP-N-acetylglucosamine 2-epimerase (non-hydrolysing)